MKQTLGRNVQQLYSFIEIPTKLQIISFVHCGSITSISSPWMPLSGTFWGMEVGFGNLSYIYKGISCDTLQKRPLWLNILVTSMFKLYYQYLPGIPKFKEFGTQQLYFIVLVQLFNVHLRNLKVFTLTCTYIISSQVSKTLRRREY